MSNPDRLLVPGRKVRVVRTVSIAFDVDIKEYLDDPNSSGITVGELETDIEDNLDIWTILDQWDDAEVTDIKIEVTQIR